MRRPGQVHLSAVVRYLGARPTKQKLIQNNSLIIFDAREAVGTIRALLC